MEVTVWTNMLKKETKYTHNKNVLSLHPSLQPKMRAILLDWLIEVCEVYTLHRETFYLAQDFFDRFMFTQENIHKSKLQLIGITSLFIAAKLEEIYPPKLHEFAYVTDGACTEDEILDMELLILKALNWELYPVTVISWLNLYLQVICRKEHCNMLLPQYSQDTFVQIAQLLDLCILDVESLSFSYSVLTAAALCYHTSDGDVVKASGLQWDCVSTCYNWMSPFAKTLSEGDQIKVKDFRQVTDEDRHNIQTHTNYLGLLVRSISHLPFLANNFVMRVCKSALLTPLPPLPTRTHPHQSGFGPAHSTALSL
uniref:Cyclin E2 n=1 Tax=Callorhinchus milii TaxID=7868 RepID=A0A4W3GU57_CALMI